MAWEICIGPEAWDEIRTALQDQFTKEQLVATLADDDYEAWETEPCYDSEGNDVETPEPNYDELKAKYERLYQDMLADLAYDRVVEHNTCDNGGNGFYIDRKGYHQVYLEDRRES